MKNIDKEFTLKLLKAIGSTFTAGYASLVLLNSEEAPEILKRNKQAIGNFEFDASRFADVLADDDSRKEALVWFLPSLNKLLVTESYEAIAEYCSCNGMFEKMKSEPWFEFARIV